MMAPAGAPQSRDALSLRGVAMVGALASGEGWFYNGSVLVPRSTSGNLDTIGSTRGSLLFRGAAAWAALTPGTAGQVLTSGGAGADPSWASAGGGGGQPVQAAGAGDYTGASYAATGSPVVAQTWDPGVANGDQLFTFLMLLVWYTNGVGSGDNLAVYLDTSNDNGSTWVTKMGTLLGTVTDLTNASAFLGCSLDVANGDHVKVRFRLWPQAQPAVTRSSTLLGGHDAYWGLKT